MRRLRAQRGQRRARPGSGQTQPCALCTCSAGVGAITRITVRTQSLAGQASSGLGLRTPNRADGRAARHSISRTHGDQLPAAQGRCMSASAGQGSQAPVQALYKDVSGVRIRVLAPACSARVRCWSGCMGLHAPAGVQVQASPLLQHREGAAAGGRHTPGVVQRFPRHVLLDRRLRADIWALRRCGRAGGASTGQLEVCSSLCLALRPDRAHRCHGRTKHASGSQIPGSGAGQPAGCSTDRWGQEWDRTTSMEEPNPTTRKSASSLLACAPMAGKWIALKSRPRTSYRRHTSQKRRTELPGCAREQGSGFRVWCPGLGQGGSGAWHQARQD